MVQRGGRKCIKKSHWQSSTEIGGFVKLPLERNFKQLLICTVLLRSSIPVVLVVARWKVKSHQPGLVFEVSVSQWYCRGHKAHTYGDEAPAIVSYSRIYSLSRSTYNGSPLERWMEKCPQV